MGVIEIVDVLQVATGTYSNRTVSNRAIANEIVVVCTDRNKQMYGIGTSIGVLPPHVSLHVCSRTLAHCALH